MSKRVLIVGSGFFGSVCARELADAGHICQVIDKRDHIGGNCFTKYCEQADCHQHVYGAHIFHTNSPDIWNYVNRFAKFNHFVNRVKVRYQAGIYSFPINLFTLYQVFNVTTPSQAKARVSASRVLGKTGDNIEDWCLRTIGRELYQLFIEGYSWKQWQKDPRELPSSIVRRLAIRYSFDDNYYHDRFQGIPIGGYTALFERLLENIRVDLKTDFLPDRDTWVQRYDHVIYTGPIDAYFGYSDGALEYRSLRHETALLDEEDFQGTAVVNYTDRNVPYTRILEHKHFDLRYTRNKTLVTKEFSQNWIRGELEYYPVNTEVNQLRFHHYQAMAKGLKGKVTFGGRLGEYRYYDMHQVIGSALKTARDLLKEWNG